MDEAVQAMEPFYRVLLVEDNEGDALLTRKAFEMAGIDGELTVMEDGEKAIEFLRRARDEDDSLRPDLILLDMNLPLKSGIEVLKEIKGDSFFKTIPVIVLSSSRAERDVLASYANHGNGYILKPYGIKRLAEVVSVIESFWFKTAVLPNE